MQCSLTSRASTRAEWSKRSSPLTHGLTIRSVAQIRKNAAAASVEFDATGGVLYARHLRMPFVALYVNLNLNKKRGRISTNIPRRGPFLLPGIFQNILESVKNCVAAYVVCLQSLLWLALKTKFWNDLNPTKNLLFCLWYHFDTCKCINRDLLIAWPGIVRDERRIIEGAAIFSLMFKIQSGSIFFAVSSFWWAGLFLLIKSSQYWWRYDHYLIRYSWAFYPTLKTRIRT